MPARDRERKNRALNDMKADPLSDDIDALQGEHQGFIAGASNPGA
jgi:hypothetical protein